MKHPGVGSLTALALVLIVDSATICLCPAERDPCGIGAFKRFQRERRNWAISAGEGICPKLLLVEPA